MMGPAPIRLLSRLFRVPSFVYYSRIVYGVLIGLNFPPAPPTFREYLKRPVVFLPYFICYILCRYSRGHFSCSQKVQRTSPTCFAGFQSRRFLVACSFWPTGSIVTFFLGSFARWTANA